MGKFAIRQDLKDLSTAELYDISLDTLREILTQLRTNNDADHMETLRQYLASISSEIEWRKHNGDF